MPLSSTANSHRAITVRAGADDDALVCGRVFERVLQQIDERGPQRVGVGHHRRASIPARRRAARSQPAAIAHRLDSGRDDGRRLGGREDEPLAVSFELREREEVLDQPAQPGVLDGQHLEILARLLRIERLIREQAVHQHAHRGQRASQLVRHGGDEIGLQPRQPQMTTQRSGRSDADDGDHADAGERDGDVEHPMLPVVLVEFRRTRSA